MGRDRPSHSSRGYSRMSDNEIVGEFLVESYENLDGDFPRATVMTSVVDFFLDNYDGPDGGHSSCSV
jgi:hypothetical protein